MTPRITINKKTNNITETWEFYFDNTTLWLDRYIVIEKEGRKTISVKKYDRLNTRDSQIDIAFAPLTEDIKSQALTTFMKMIKVEKWSRN